MNIINLLSKIKFVPLHFVFWVLVWLFYIYFFGFNAQNQDYAVWFASLLIPVTIVTTYFTIYFLIPKYLLVKKYSLFILHGIYTLIGSAYIIAVTMYLGLVFRTNLDIKEMPPMSRSFPFILISVYLIVILVSAFALLKHNYVSLEQNKTLENKFLETQLLLKQEELKFLKMQIQPHFLFNTLNTLYGLAQKKSPDTPEMILKLSNLLDYILYQTNQPIVSLPQEINHIKDYIDLEKMRFNDSLSVSFKTLNIDENFQLAPMMLIPFVENSFKHGHQKDGILNIIIEITTKNNELNFTIRNTQNSDQTHQQGIGLTNSKKRLNLLYPDTHRLKISSSKNEFSISLSIPNQPNHA